jgi:DNA-binding CsgD family transcriptional regulator
MRGLPALPFGLSDDRGDLPATSLRQLHNVLAVLRWVGLVWVGVLALLTPPRWPLALTVLILWIGVYNGWAMFAGGRAADHEIHRIASTVALLDQLTYFVFIGIFVGTATGTVYAIFTFMLVEAIAIDGVRGAIQAVLVFYAGFTAEHAFRAYVLNTPFLTTDLLVWSLFYTYGAAVITAVDRILVRGRVAQETTIGRPVPTMPTNGAALRLSQREHEVLRLVAEGYSNTMIATRLHLSESTVKTHVEALLARLNARNRAEAVAAASRLQLL